MWNRISCLRLTAAALLAVFPGSTQAGPTPGYSQTFGDAITGDNQFIAPDGRNSWFINTGADDYYGDFYERPTIQNYEWIKVQSLHALGTDAELATLVGKTISAANSSGPSYFEYIDITRGFFGFNATHMIFGIELFGDEKVSADGTRTPDFGESAYYRVRISGDPDGAFGLMLSAEAAADFQKSEFMSFTGQKAFGYLDANGDVGGPGGIPVVHENPGGMNGYSQKVISDGKAEAGSKPEILTIRRTDNADTGRPVVEFVLNYVEYNNLYANSDPNSPHYLDPLNLHMVFEANRGGPKDHQNYLWNDKYSFTEGGTPYDPANEPQNIYELDTLRAGTEGISSVVPEPSSVALLGLGCVGLLALRRRTHGLSVIR